jgi:hypothetical protein
MGGEAQSETEPAVTMLWSLADPDLAELHDNGDGTASVTAKPSFAPENSGSSLLK